MRRSQWQYRTTTEKRYAEAVEKAIKRAFESLGNPKTVDAIVSHLLKITESAAFRHVSNSLATRMVRMVMVENARTWREAVRQGTDSHQIYKLLRHEMDNTYRFKEMIGENAHFIRTMPLNLAKEITQKASEASIAGKRPESIVNEILAEAHHMNRWQARRLARTEIAKTNANITQIRAQELDIQWFQWHTAEDQRVRSSHAHLDKVYCTYTDLPAPETLIGQKSQGHYGPGGIYNCRCYAQPMVNLDYVSAPIKIYYQGRIQTVSLSAFRRLVDPGFVSAYSG